MYWLLVDFFSSYSGFNKLTGLGNVVKLLIGVIVAWLLNHRCNTQLSKAANQNEAV